MSRRTDQVRRATPWLCLVASIAINAVQGNQILRLEDALDSRTGLLAEGSVVPDLKVRDLSGLAEVIAYASASVPTVLYVFRPSCTWCERNSENINSLAVQLNGKFRLIGLSTSREGLSEFISAHQIKFPVYTDISESLMKAYRLHTTPETVVISPEGKVIKTWAGAYLGSTASMIEMFFSVHLPG